jgi:signal transduction histidine kinase/DNA-binding response OmpR family regulator/ligand-binding sensor domain-containing protein
LSNNPLLQAAVIAQNITNIDGLSNNAVNCIFQDSKGFMWFGTWDGLSRYNGREIVNFRYAKTDENSISNNIIRQIAEQNGKLWISTDNGINRYDCNNNNFKRYYLGAEQKTPRQEKSFQIAVSPAHILYCFVKDNGLYYFDDKTDKFNLIQIDFLNNLDNFFISNRNNLIIKLKDGRTGYMNIDETPEDIKISSFNFISRGGGLRIFYSQPDLFICTETGIDMFDKQMKFTRHIAMTSDKIVSQIIRYGDLLYISQIDGGCTTFDLLNNTFETLPQIPANVSVFSLCFGNQDILWIGTDGQGVFQIYDYNFPFQKYAVGNAARAFIELDENILIGTKGGGIKIFNRETKQIKNRFSIANGLVNNSLYTFAKNRNGDIFMGTEGEGITILYAKTGETGRLNMEHIPFFKSVYNLLFTNNDSVLWVGTSGYGLLRLSLNRKNVTSGISTYYISDFEQFNSQNCKILTNDVIYAIAADRHNLWFGTRGGGLYRLKINEGNKRKGKANQALTPIPLEEINDNLQLTNNDILSLNYSNSTLWIGTSYGLNKLKESNGEFTLTQYTDRNGLSNNTIHSILVGGDRNVWISTNQGISVIGAGDSIKNFEISDGLQNSEFSDGAAYIDSENTLYFGGVSGFNAFNPEKIQFRNYKASIVLTSINVFNTPQNIFERTKNNTLKLLYSERYITLEFAALDFINNENCEYRYRITGIADEWISLGNKPVIILSNIPPGNYTLEVRATNGDKIWNENTLTFKLKAGYPWWLSLGAILIYIIAIAVLMYFVQSIIKHRIRLNRQLFIGQLEKQHQKEIYEQKMNFFTNIAHEFITPLTLIYAPVQQLLDNQDIDSFSKKYLQTIKSNTDRMKKLIVELLEFRKIKKGHTPLRIEEIDIKLLIGYVSDNYIEVLKENKISYQIHLGEISNIFSDSEALEKIFFNLFSNAYKYTPRGGYIYVNVAVEIDSHPVLQISIRNSGGGLTEQQMREIFDKYKIFDTPKTENTFSTGIGLNLTKSLTEMLGGKIEVNSELGEYTEFCIAIPSMQIDAGATQSAVTGLQAVPETTTLRSQTGASKCSNILIVEDDKNIRELLRDILSPQYGIVEAQDGAEALKLVENNQPDVIISDIVMPNLDGIGLIKQLKSNAKTAHIPLISLSAQNSEESHINAYKFGADIYIDKPFNPKHLLISVENLLRRQAQLKEYYNSRLSAIKVKDGIEIHVEDQKLLEEITDYILKNFEDETLDPNSIADFLAVSKASLYRKLKEITGKTPSELIRSIRIEQASKLLKNTNLTVSEIMYRVGFSNRSYFNREFLKQYGKPPKEWRDEKIIGL